MWIQLESADGERSIKPHFFRNVEVNGRVIAKSLCGKIRIWNGGNEDDITSFDAIEQTGNMGNIDSSDAIDSPKFTIEETFTKPLCVFCQKKLNKNSEIKSDN